MSGCDRCFKSEKFLRSSESSILAGYSTVRLELSKWPFAVMIAKLEALSVVLIESVHKIRVLLKSVSEAAMVKFMSQKTIEWLRPPDHRNKGKSKT